MKSLLSSKTFWLAFLQSCAGVAVVVETNYPGLGGMMLVKSFIDIALRLVTVQPVKIL